MFVPSRLAVWGIVAICLGQTAWAQPAPGVPYDPAPGVPYDPVAPAPIPAGPLDPLQPYSGDLPPLPDSIDALPEPVPPLPTTGAPLVEGVPVAPATDGWAPSAHWRRPGHAPGGDYVTGTRVGAPYYYNAPGYRSVGADGGTFGWTGRGWTGYGGADPYVYHFGPGYHRHSNFGHYRFPFYSYRRPWYFAGPPSYNRDTNFPW